MNSTIRRAMSSAVWPPSVSSWSSRLTTSKASSEELVLAGEYFADGVVREDLADRFRQQVRRRNDADHLRRAVAQRDRVGDDDARQRRLGQVLPGVAGEDAVGGDGVDLLGALLHHGSRGGGERST